MQRLFVLLTFLSLAACAASSPPAAPAPRAAAVDSIVEAAMHDGPIPGVSVAITRGGVPVLMRGYGYADLEHGVPAVEKTVYRIGSVTKQFTAAAIMRLVEQGRIELDDPVSEYLPGLASWAGEVTIHQLLNHTSGVKSYTSLGPTWMEIMPLDRTHEQMVALFRDAPTDFAPGEQWRYNNSGYYLLGMIIEKVTGQSYAEYLEEEFYGPLGLDATVYCSEGPLIPNRAEGYVVQDGEFRNDAPISMTQPYSAGSLCSTVGDLARWARALARGEVVSPASYRQMIEPTRLADGKEQAYGYGLSTGKLGEEPYVAHGGGINGFISQLAYYPEADVAIAVLSNSQNANSSAIEQQIARRVLGIPAPEVRNLPLDAEERARYVGKYEVDLGTVEILEDGGRLVMRGPFESSLLYQGDHEFAPAANPYDRVVFRVEGGRAVGLTITVGDVQLKGERVK